MYLQSPLGSFWSPLKKSVWHLMASQKYSINEHVPTSGRAASLPERITERRKALFSVTTISTTTNQSGTAEPGGGAAVAKLTFLEEKFC